MTENGSGKPLSLPGSKALIGFRPGPNYREG